MKTFYSFLQEHVYLFLLVFVGLVPLFSLLTPGLPVTHDGQDHVARIANFYQALREGVWIPRWAAHLNWGYGHPILMFLYPFSSYVGSFFHSIGFSLVDSTKLIFATGYIASGVAMFLWLRYVFGAPAAFVGAIVYLFAPYRFVDMYVRGAIGEHMAFIFPPIICLGFARLISHRSFDHIGFSCVVLGMTFLILAHNALGIMFFGILVFYAMYLLVFESRDPKKHFVVMTIATLIGIGLASFYWIPGFFEGKYTLRDIVTKGEFASRFVPVTAFFYSPWSYGGSEHLSKWLGAGAILGIVASFWVIEKSDSYRRLILGIILLLAFCLILMTKLSQPLWDTVTILQKFQFPWRILSVVTFLSAILCGVVVAGINKKAKKWLLVGIVALSIATTVYMWQPRAYKVYDESFFTGIYNSTTDTGESSPIWSVRFMESRPLSRAQSYPSGAIIKETNRTTTMHEYSVETKEPIRFVDNTLYFPGWRVWINDTLQPHEKLIFQDPTYRGLMTFDMNPGRYVVRFEFGDTKLRTVANYVSLISLVCYLVALGTIKLVWKQNPKKD